MNVEPGRPCGEPDCPGTIGATGFCMVCGFRPAGTDDVTAVLPPESPPESRPTEVVPPSVAPAGFARPNESATITVVPGAEPGTLPELAVPEPASRILLDPRVPEDHRHCGDCGGPVGRTVAGNPGATEGHCPNCGAGFSLSPKLHEGDLVAGQYEVLGCVAHGGLGWVYLARDRNLGDRHVALKGLINTYDTAAAEMAVQENQYLTELEHSNLVRIFNVVTHPDPVSGEVTSYTVMDYVGGLSLREVAVHADISLDIEHVVDYGREILTAFIYLHEQGLLYCDMKPDNVIHGENGVKLIDLGAVRRIGDRTSPIVGTPGYLVSDAEIGRYGLTERSDIHTVGVTLDELFQTIPKMPAGSQLEPAVESFRRVLDRARSEYAYRFATAREMLAQLDGVHTEILSLRDGESRPVPSSLFAESAMLADGGLGQPPHLEVWTSAGPDRATWSSILDDGRPGSYELILGLPTPVEDPRDPAVDFLKTVHAPDAGSLLRKLRSFGPNSVEIEFRACRAHLERSNVREAQQALDNAARLLADLAPYDWRIPWHRGLVCVASQDIQAAIECFERVHRDIPGEIAPKLALALCLEQDDDGLRAERLYRAVWTRDRTQVSAAFGLARMSLARDDRASAVEVLEQVPEVSRHYDAAMTGTIRILAGRLAAGGAGLPSGPELSKSIARLEWSYVDGFGERTEAEERLATAVRETALDWVRAGRSGTVDGGSLLGPELTEDQVRVRLERSYRRLAGQAHTPEDHGVLVDRANTVRSRTRF